LVSDRVTRREVVLGVGAAAAVLLLGVLALVPLPAMCGSRHLGLLLHARVIVLLLGPLILLAVVHF
jgi:hypothetical protein